MELVYALLIGAGIIFSILYRSKYEEAKKDSDVLRGRLSETSANLASSYKKSDSLEKTCRELEDRILTFQKAFDEFEDISVVLTALSVAKFTDVEHLKVKIREKREENARTATKSTAKQTTRTTRGTRKRKVEPGIGGSGDTNPATEEVPAE